MVIVASGMARGRVRLATTTTTTLPQHGGHSHPGYLEGLKPKRGFVFRALFAACRGYTTYSQQSTAVYNVLLKKRIIHSGFGGKNFLPTSFQAFLEGHKHKAEFFLQVFKHFWRDCVRSSALLDDLTEDCKTNMHFDTRSRIKGTDDKRRQRCHSIRCALHVKSRNHSKSFWPSSR